MLRYALARRWWAWHLLCLCLAAAFIAMGIWQLHVATAPISYGGSLNLRNFVYALQWWAFTCFGIWFWFRFIRDQRDAEMAGDAGALTTIRNQGEQGSEVVLPVGAAPQISLDARAQARRRAREAAAAEDGRTTAGG